MSTIIAAFKDGWRRVVRAPAILLGVWLLDAAHRRPGRARIGASIAGSLGHSLEAGSMAAGVNHEWWERFAETAAGLDRTFTPTIIGFGAVLDNLSRFLDNGDLALGVAGLAAPTCWCGCSSPAACSIGTPATARRAPRRSSARAARSSSASSGSP